MASTTLKCLAIFAKFIVWGGLKWKAQGFCHLVYTLHWNAPDYEAVNVRIRRKCKYIIISWCSEPQCEMNDEVEVWYCLLLATHKAVRMNQSSVRISFNWIWTKSQWDRNSSTTISCIWKCCISEVSFPLRNAIYYILRLLDSISNLPSLSINHLTQWISIVMEIRAFEYFSMIIFQLIDI